MLLYDLISPFYDPVLRGFYRPFRQRAFDLVPPHAGMVALDLACGTGQNFPWLAERMGLRGHIIGVDISSGMLKRARHLIDKSHFPEVTLLQLDAATLSPAILKAKARVTAVDLVVCSFGFTAMASWETAFHRAFGLLRPGGRFLILDVHAEKRTFHVRLVEAITRITETRPIAPLLQRQCFDFHVEQLDPSRHLFGGHAFAATGTRHA